MKVLIEQRADGHWYYNHRLPEDQIEAQSGRPVQSGGTADGEGQGPTAALTTPKLGDRSAANNIGRAAENSDRNPARLARERDEAIRHLILSAMQRAGVSAAAQVDWRRENQCI